MVRIGLYFDFVSPYAWLGLERAWRLARDSDWTWELHPVVYAKLLEATGLTGPAETELKRRHLFWDVARQAARLQLTFQGPPAHPFRSLDALRTQMVFRDHPRALELAAALARAAWSEGRDLTDPVVLEAIVSEVGLEESGWTARLGDPAIKDALRRSTASALEVGVFGVPTFEWQGELFWGQDRIEDLEARVSGELRIDARAVSEMLARPRGSERRLRGRG